MIKKRKKKTGPVQKERADTAETRLAEGSAAPSEEGEPGGPMYEEINPAPKKKAADKSARGLPARIAIRTAKALFVWTPLVLVALLILVFAGLKIYLTPERVERLIVSGFNQNSYGDISLKVREFNPFTGFRIDDIVIRNGEEFNKTRFVEIEKLVLRYGFFPMLIGNVRFNEIGIYRPRIYLTEKDGVWNAARLMKPGEPKPEKEKEPEEPKGPPKKEIKLPVSVEFLFKFVLDDLRFYMNGSRMQSSLEGLTFGVDIRVPPFKRVPLSVEAVSILEKMDITLNPREEMNVTFVSREAEVGPPLILTWKLLYKKENQGRPQFESRFKFGTYRTPVRFRRQHLAPLTFMVSYDLLYEPLTDFLRLNQFGVGFNGRRLFNLAGEVKEVSTKQNFSLRMTESDINLNELYPYFRQLTGNTAMRFGGSISLAPLTVRGNPKDVDIDGELSLRRIYFRQPGVEANIPSLTFAYNVQKRSDDMDIIASIDMPHLNYMLERSKSGDNGLSFKANVSAYENFSRIHLNGISMNFYNPASLASALRLALNGRVGLKGGQSGNVSITELRFSKTPLASMLPPKFAKSLAGVPLKKPVDITMNASFAKGGSDLRAVLDMLVKVPDFNVSDLVMSVDVQQSEREKRLALHRFHLGSAGQGLSIDAGGVVDLRNAPGPATDLSLSVRYRQDNMKAVYGDWNLSGDVELSTKVKGDMKNGRAFGSMRIAKFNVRNAPSKMSVEDFNMNFPFEYYFTPRMGASRILVDRSLLISNQYFMEKENFTIRSIKAKHPARDVQFEYVKDFAATMFFRNNTFEIEKMKAYVLGGALYGRSILFNLMDMKPKNMEYKLVLDVTNVDIGTLDDPDPSRKTRDAELSLTTNFAGKGIIGKGKDFSRELDVTGNINIFRIGRKFADRLMKGLSEEKGKSKLGSIGQFAMDNSMRVKGFNFRLDKGLMYTTVTLARGGIGYVFGIKDEKIQFDRVPIQDYLSKVREE